MTVKTFSPFLAMLGVAVVGALAVGCSSETSNPPALTIQKAASASGDAQTDSVLDTLPNPLRVVVMMGSTPQAGRTVSWATSGAEAAVIPTSSTTDANGVATTRWKLSHVAGGQTATATLAGATGSPVTFTATATPGDPTDMIDPTGDAQHWMVGTVLPQPLTVKVADHYGNGVAGQMVDWAVTSGAASAGVSPANATTDASGVARTTVTLGGTPGSATISATNSSLNGSPQSFDVTADPIPTTAAVTVGPSIKFTSDRNNSSNPAVDTIAVGGTVTWTWAANSFNHSVQSTGAPSFTSSSVKNNGTHQFTFTTAGTYEYNCQPHGNSMTGTIVVR